MKEKFCNWGVLFKLNIRRDLKKIAFWIIGLGLFSSIFIVAFKEIAKGSGLIGMYETLKNPAMISMIGPISVSTPAEYTLGVMYANMMLLFSAMLSMIVSSLYVIQNTRKAEDDGLSELIRSFQIGRHANTFAVLFQAIVINFFLAIFITTILSLLRIDTITFKGSLVYASSIGMAGVLGSVISLLISQLMPQSSEATGLTFIIIGLLYIIRAVTDIYFPILSFYNPLAWTYLSFPFSKNSILPFFLGLLFTIIISAAAIKLESTRDMRTGHIQKSKLSHRNKSLNSIQSLFFHLNMKMIITSILSFFILASAYGAIYGDMNTFINSNELMSNLFMQAGYSVEVSFTATLIIILIGLVSILPTVIINRLYKEETGGYLSQVYSTKVTRSRLYWSNVIIAITVSILGVLITTLGLGLVATFVMDNDSMNLFDFLISGFNLLPTVLFFTSLSAFFLGFKPELSKIVYVYIGYSFLLSYISGLVNFPNWILKSIPQNWIARMPIESFDLNAFVILTLVSFFIFLLGYIGFKKRDMIEAK